MKQSIKESVMELREIVFGGHNVDMETYAIELSSRSPLSFDDIKDVFNNLSLLYTHSKNPKVNASGKKIWEDFEDKLMLSYMELAQKNGIKKKSALLDLCDILIDRSESSIPFRYYHITSNRDKKIKRDNTESKLKVIPNIVPEVESKPENKDDLLDIVVDIVDNVETADVDVNSLFKGILALSQKAVANSNQDKLEALEGQVTFLESELDNEKKKNNSLQLEMSRLINEFENLKNEIEYFNGLDGKQKLQQLNNFNKKMKYMVDKFGGVIAVGM